MSHDHDVKLTPKTYLLAIAVASVAVILIVAIGAIIGEWIPASVAVGNHPFSVGVSEGGAATNRLAMIILDIQARFSTAMTSSLALLKDGKSGLLALTGLGFAYGIFHAAGPGHGKAVIAAYAFSREKAIGRTIGMASAAAALQTFVAIALVTILSVIIHVTAPTMRSTTHDVELLSFLIVATVGLALLWSKAKHFAFTLAHLSDDHDHAHHDHAHHDHHHHDHHHDHANHAHAHHGHSHAPIAPRGSGWRGMVSAIIAAGIRPCSGSILVLVFALSQSVYLAGLFAAIAIGLGTAITTSALAVFAILAKAAASRLLHKRSAQGALLMVNGLEVFAAALVFALGASLMIASLSGLVPNG